jgi:hypothetical protein
MQVSEGEYSALKRQLVELTGTADEVMAMRAGQERAARIELLHRQVSGTADGL